MPFSDELLKTTAVMVTMALPEIAVLDCKRSDSDAGGIGNDDRSGVESGAVDGSGTGLPPVTPLTCQVTAALVRVSHGGGELLLRAFLHIGGRRGSR